jgi:aryl-alcohol dehydrogenase-like predicted oxidoreductase
MFTARTLRLTVADWPKPSILALGTATFGMPYGIANPSEQASAAAVGTMLERAWEAGVTAFDTAPPYGEAESRLGAWIKRRDVVPHVVSKLPSLAGVADADVGKAVDDAIAGSTVRLGLPPASFLAHDAADYLRPAIRERLHAAAARGAIGVAGVSVYAAAEVFAALATGPPAAIQVPISAFDQRMIASGALAACAAAGITVFARSVFLQGVMLMEPGRIPAEMAELQIAVAAFDALCAAENTTRASFALRHVRDLPGVRSTIVGAYTPEQLAALTEAAKEPPLTVSQRAAAAAIAQKVPEKLLDPRNWPRSR